MQKVKFVTVPKDLNDVARVMKMDENGIGFAWSEPVGFDTPEQAQTKRDALTNEKQEWKVVKMTVTVEDV